MTSTSMMDESFGLGGGVLVRYPHARASAVAHTQAGRVLVAGEARDTIGPSSQLLLAQLLDDGSIDASFGASGLLALRAGPDGGRASMAVLHDGSVVLAHGAKEPGAGSVVRIDDRGHRVFTHIIGVPPGTASQAEASTIAFTVVESTDDGGFLAAGNALRTDGSASDFCVARFLPDGSPDHNFGWRGVVNTDFAGRTYLVSALLTEPDGSTVTVGTVEGPGGSLVAVLRFDRAGALDPSFGQAGMCLSAYEARSGRALAGAMTTSRIIVAGGQDLDAGGHPAFAAFHRNGSPESNPSRDRGPTLHRPNDPRLLRQPGEFTAMGVDSNGRLLIAGRLEGTRTRGVALARFTAAGVLDASFGNEGVSITALNNGGGCATGLAIDPEDRVVVTAETSRPQGLIVLRALNPPTRLDLDSPPVFMTPDELRQHQAILLTQIQSDHEMAMRINRAI